MGGRGLRPDIYTYTAAMRAAISSNKPARALQVPSPTLPPSAGGNLTLHMRRSCRPLSMLSPPAPLRKGILPNALPSLFSREEMQRR